MKWQEYFNRLKGKEEELRYRMFKARFIAEQQQAIRTRDEREDQLHQDALNEAIGFGGQG